MALMEKIVRHQKTRWLLSRIHPGSRILEIGCGSGWVKAALKGVGTYVGLDMNPPADIVGDVRNWRSMGLAAGSFDAIVCFEVVEHVDCFRECYDLLRPGGIMFCTTPAPRWDWMLQILEAVGVNQKRTSSHDHLIDLNRAPYFSHGEIRRFLVMSQWAVFTKDEQ